MMLNRQRKISRGIKYTCWIFVVILLTITMAFSAFADNITKYQQQLNEKKNQITSYDKKIKQLDKDINWNKQKRDQVIKELEQLGLKQEEIEQQIQLLESALQTLNDAIAITEEELAKQEALLQERLRVMYKYSSTVWRIDQIFKSKDWNEFFQRVRLMNDITRYDRMLENSIKEKRQELEELKAQREYEIENCVEIAKRYAQQRQELEISRSSLEAAIQRDIQAKEKYEKGQDLIIEESKKLEKLLKEEQSKSNRNLKFGGKMVWPMPTNKQIASTFGNRLHPIYKVWKMHTGIDIGSKLNEGIVAAADGVVIFAGKRDGYGNCIIIDHGDGITTLYAHINNGGIKVVVGQSVKAGQLIAHAGQTGVATGPHLHFEVRKDGVPQNPLDYVKP